MTLTDRENSVCGHRIDSSNFGMEHNSYMDLQLQQAVAQQPALIWQQLAVEQMAVAQAPAMLPQQLAVEQPAVTQQPIVKQQKPAVEQQKPTVEQPQSAV